MDSGAEAFAEATRAFPRDTVNRQAVRRALLDIAGHLGARLRGRGLLARTLTLTVRYADRSTTVRSRPLPEPTSSSATLTRAAYRVHDSLALQRARVRAVSLRVADLAPAGAVSTQLTLDDADDRARRLEATIDRVTARFGPGAVLPAALLRADRSRAG